MPDLRTQEKVAVLIITISLIIQTGFAIGTFGPAWLSPILTLPALAVVTRLWWRAEKEHAASRAFTELVI